MKHYSISLWRERDEDLNQREEDQSCVSELLLNSNGIITTKFLSPFNADGQEWINLNVNWSPVGSLL